jgi:hypothetical protein
MMRKLAAVAATVALAGSTLLVSAGAASAGGGGGGPVGGCPQGGGWFLISTSQIFPDIDKGNFHDQNGDGFACAKAHKDGSWTVKDNTN